MAKVYVGCSLTLAPKEFVRGVEIFKHVLRLEGHEVADFVGLVNGTAQDVYETDVHKCVADCDLFLAILDYPSIGLGWELGAAVEKFNKPTLAVARHDAKISRLPIGADCPRNPHYRFRRYHNLLEVVRLLSEFLREVNVAV